MSEERFEQLRQLAREEFDVEIVKKNEASSFKEVFGFDVEEMKTNNMGD